MNTLIILSALGLLGLLSEIFSFKKALLPLVFVGLIAAGATTVADWQTNRHYFNEMMVMDNYALAFTSLLILVTFCWFIIAPRYFSDPTNESDHFSLIIFALIGAVTMVSFNNMIMLFLGIEILSISMYILAGSSKRSLESNEAALKYFLMGSFATGFLLFGIALIYGVTGSFQLDIIAGKLQATDVSGNVLAIAGMLLIVIALAFKVSAAPFHFWAPDVYQGSPTVITAYMSTVVKTAAIAAFFRLFLHAFSTEGEVWKNTIWVLSALTILVGNITAVYQTNVKRMLAYSSIAHAGYMLMAILALNSTAPAALLYYTAAYSISSITSFGILMIVANFRGGEGIESFNGLARKNPLLAAITVIAMLSLAGIPPTAGFFAKYFIFSSALQQGNTALVLIAVLGSLIGVFYYFRILIALFKDTEASEIPMNTAYKAILVVTSLLALVLGLTPELVAGLL